MSEPEIEEIVRENIEKTVHMSLATCANNTPWVCEVHFAYDQELNLYFRSLKSRRHSQEIEINPTVAGNIVKQHEINEPVVGIYFEGQAKILESGEDQETAAESIQKRLGLSSDILEEARKEDGHQFYKISVKNWYIFGRFGAQHGQKYKLPWKNQNKT